MKRLEDIPKKNMYQVPDGYFDQLPGRIQSRITSQPAETRPLFTYVVRYALPVLLIGAVAFWYYETSQPGAPQTAEEILASIDTESLITYLQESDVSTEELVEIIELTSDDVQGIEDVVYELPFSDEALDELLNEYDDEWNNL